jgi:outer membrane protein assembly factor BamB
VIAAGKVFVTAAEPRRGSRLLALSARTGRTLWRVDLGHRGGADIAYDEGRLYVSRPESPDFPDRPRLLAFRAADGRPLWGAAPASTGAPPVAAGGVVYVSGQFYLHAFRGADGAELWRVPTDGGDGTPAVGPDAVYVSFACGQVYGLARDTGRQLWHAQYGCHGGGATTPVLHAGRLYVRDDVEYPPGAVYDAATGARLGPMRADYAPAFAGGLGLFPDAIVAGEPLRMGHTLVARPVDGGAVRWRFGGDGYLDTAPLVVNGTVYVGSGSGRIYALSLRRGRVRWRARLPRPVLGSDERSGFHHGLAAGEGLLVVPAFGRLFAFRGAR